VWCWSVFTSNCRTQSSSHYPLSIVFREDVLNQATEDWDTARVTLSGVPGLVCRPEASPPAPHDPRDRGRARGSNVAWLDLESKQQKRYILEA